MQGHHNKDYPNAKNDATPPAHVRRPRPTPLIVRPHLTPLRHEPVSNNPPALPPRPHHPFAEVNTLSSATIVKPTTSSRKPTQPNQTPTLTPSTVVRTSTSATTNNQAVVAPSKLTTPVAADEYGLMEADFTTKEAYQGARNRERGVTIWQRLAGADLVNNVNDLKDGLATFSAILNRRGEMQKRVAESIQIIPPGSRSWISQLFCCTCGDREDAASDYKQMTDDPHATGPSMAKIPSR